MAYFDRKGYGKYHLTDEQKEEVYPNKEFTDYNGMINQMSRITKLPKFIVRMVYDAEEFIMEEIGLIKSTED